MEQGKNEVVLQLLENEEASNPKREIRDSKGSPLAESSSNSLYRNTHMDSSPKSPELLDNFRSSGSPELKKSPAESRKVPPVIRRRSMVRSEFSKPKSRLLEPSYPKDSNFIEEKTQKQSPKKPSSSSNKNSPSMDFPNQKVNETPITPRTPLIGEDGEEEEEEDDEEVYKTANLQVSQKPGKKWRLKFMLEWIALICILGFLIASFTVNKLQNRVMWGLELWKWCVLALVILCGRLVTYWFMNFLVFLIEMNFFFKKKVLYFVYGVKKSVQLFIWLSLVLLAWSLLFNHGVPRSRKTTRVLNYITRALGSCLIGVTMWLVKTLLIKLLAASFQSSRFFDRIQEAIFHQYILRALSGPPVMELAEMVGKTGSSGRLSFRTFNKGSGEGKKEEVIDVNKLKRMKQEKISAWTMKGLINVIRTSGLYTISGSSESDDDYDESETKEKEITSAWEAKAAAYRIFMNVAKPGSNYIEKEDLLRFMNKEEVENVLPLFEGAVETGKIKRKSLKNWLVKVYLERQSLVHSLNDTKTAVEELNKLASVIVLVVIIIVWLLIMGFLTTKILVFISSQLLLVVFMFGNTAKTVFEAIIFVFVMHPFDVGDRCVIDGVQMVVEEMNILTTVFLRYDNEKIFYPNSVLASKPISNFYRSPEMSDSIEFSVDFSTSVESIGALKAKIKGCLEIKPQHWRPNHSVVVKGIEDMNKLKMALNVTHTINFQNYGDKNSRRSELILELKKIFEDLNIKYHLPPQEVHLSYAGPAATSAQPACR